MWQRYASFPIYIRVSPPFIYVGFPHLYMCISPYNMCFLCVLSWFEYVPFPHLNTYVHFTHLHMCIFPIYICAFSPSTYVHSPHLRYWVLPIYIYAFPSPEYAGFPRVYTCLPRFAICVLNIGVQHNKKCVFIVSIPIIVRVLNAHFVNVDKTHFVQTIVHVFLCNGGAISWQSRKQDLVASSTT